MTGLAFAELTSRYLEAAGEAVFVAEGLGRPWLGAVVGLAIVVTGIVSTAAIASGFPGYLDIFVQLPHAAASAGLVIVLGAVAARGIREAVWTAAIITVLEVVGLILVVGVAGGSLADLTHRAPELVPTTGAGASGHLTAHGRHRGAQRALSGATGGGLGRRIGPGSWPALVAGG